MRFPSVLCIFSPSTISNWGSLGEWSAGSEVCIRKTNSVASLLVLGQMRLCTYLVGSENHWLLCFPSSFVSAFVTVLYTGSMAGIIIGVGDIKRNKAHSQPLEAHSTFKELENYGRAWGWRQTFPASQIPSPFANGARLSADVSDKEN